MKRLWVTYLGTGLQAASADPQPLDLPPPSVHTQFANFVREMFTDVQLPVRQGWGWGRGKACIPPATPTPLTLPYILLYICTVHELCSRTVGEYRLCYGHRVHRVMALYAF
jgi:hypothetical protein